ncbi:MAG: hypothetical protein JNL90_02135 [Planctomycetes bacterium]|nr:hypothetical protein [Planctomycetota bacterium]
MRLRPALHAAVATFATVAASADGATLPRAPLVPQQAVADATAARAAATFDALPIAADELPADWLLEGEVACASPTAQKLFEGQLLPAVVGAPTRMTHQTIGGASGRGTLLYFEFEGEAPTAWMDALVAALWSEKGKPTRTQPELLARAGNCVVVISCSLRSPLRRFACERLRRRFGLRLPDPREERTRPLAPLAKAAAEGDLAGAQLILAARKKELEPLSLAWTFTARAHVAKEQWLEANRAFAKALELDATSDPLPDDATHLACVAGRGQALYHQQKWPEAVALLREAAALAARCGQPRARAAAHYDAACCLALAGDGDGAMAELERALAVEPGRAELVAQAQQDADLESLKRRPEWAERVK